jgi:hypothetical protein
MRFFALLAFAVLGSSGLGTARAAETPQACAKSYERAQEEKAAGRLSSALAHLKTCIAPECPAFIREDCMRWMEKSESELPTVVFSVREDGKELTDVEIACDNNPLTRKLDSKAVPVEPGLHDFAFSVPGYAPIAREIQVREGERDRIIIVELHRPVEIIPLTVPSSSGAATTSQAEPTPRSRRLVPYALAGVGALGLAGFTVFAILGNSQAADLERTCSPYCQSGQVDSVKSKYHLADVSLGVGLVSLGVATYLWVRNPGREDREPKSATAIDFIPRSAGGVLRVSTSY